jgi:hypothetical protein
LAFAIKYFRPECNFDVTEITDLPKTCSQQWCHPSFYGLAAVKRILSVSCDPNLLRSREDVLRSGGLNVTSTLCVTDAVPLCESGEFCLLIVGHSVPDERKAELTARFRTGCKGAVLALHTSLEAPDSGADYTFNTGDGPAKLMAFVLSNNRQRLRNRVAGRRWFMIVKREGIQRCPLNLPIRFGFHVRDWLPARVPISSSDPSAISATKSSPPVRILACSA